VLDPRLPEDVSALSTLSIAWRGFEKALDDLVGRKWSQPELGRL
jgi:hypothetical protein